MKEMLDAKDEVIWELVKYVKSLEAGATADANQEVV